MYVNRVPDRLWFTGPCHWRVELQRKPVGAAAAPHEAQARREPVRLVQPTLVLAMVLAMVLAALS